MSEAKHTPGREIRDFPGYSVHNDGTIVSSLNWRGIPVRALVPISDTDGYLKVRLVVKGKRRNIKVHRLVALAFLGAPPSPFHEVRHIDGNRLNNHAENLAWGTSKENADDRERHGRTSRGERHARFIRRGLLRAAIAKAKGGAA